MKTILGEKGRDCGGTEEEGFREKSRGGGGLRK